MSPFTGTTASYHTSRQVTPPSISRDCPLPGPTLTRPPQAPRFLVIFPFLSLHTTLSLSLSQKKKRETVPTSQQRHGQTISTCQPKTLAFFQIHKYPSLSSVSRLQNLSLSLKPKNTTAPCQNHKLIALSLSPSDSILFRTQARIGRFLPPFISLYLVIILCLSNFLSFAYFFRISRKG